ncbi:MAG: hypothetical protein KIH08_10040 [Candidatus Freyarchaeota archaeon]|nr:hypothetical protein [Candidatus Jordarchaeia archaeon]MBS7269045.1 hypothetical protein [Candidatus Jordarchaeia archaeon]MBS7278624.1 hypothetical protein [Candidatus Jordarchaeia archaeon]
MSYGKLKKYDALLNDYRELYHRNVFDYIRGAEVTSQIVSLSKELEAHYENKARSADSYYSPLMEAIRVFFKSQRCLLEVSNRLFKMEINDYLFSFEDEHSLSKVRVGNKVLEIGSNPDTQKTIEILLEALGHIKPCLPELESASKKILGAKDKDLSSMLEGAINLLNSKIHFFNSLVKILEGKFEEAIYELEESIKNIEGAIKSVKTNLDTPGEVENAKKTEAYLELVIDNHKNSITKMKQLTSKKAQ